VQQPSVRNSLLTGAGLAILANSRPFEGLLVSLPAGILLFIHIINQRGQGLWISFKKIAVPIFVVLAVTATGMGFYNLRTTGNPLRMPYQIHEETYAMAPIFLWQKLPPEPEYRHKVIRDFHATFALSYYTSQRSIPGFVIEDMCWLLLLRFRGINIFMIPVIIVFPVLVAWALRDRWARFALMIYFVLGLGLVIETFKLLHYIAPITGLDYYFVLNALRLAQWRNRKIGQLMFWLTPLLAITALVVSLYGKIKTDNSSTWQAQREQLLRRLKQEDGKHLVIVDYGPEHSFQDEWVYNEADIDHSKVVFARAINSTQDCQLVEYFKSRRIWSLDVDGDHLIPKLRPYPRSQCEGMQPTNY
jgi:hypothetical protein